MSQHVSIDDFLNQIRSCDESSKFFLIKSSYNAAWTVDDILSHIKNISTYNPDVSFKCVINYHGGNVASATITELHNTPDGFSEEKASSYWEVHPKDWRPR